jgi:hypothetical protein
MKNCDSPMSREACSIEPTSVLLASATSAAAPRRVSSERRSDHVV